MQVRQENEPQQKPAQAQPAQGESLTQMLTRLGLTGGQQ